jgi:Holliday junction resolvase RusA-like endonuclease
MKFKRFKDLDIEKFFTYSDVLNLSTFVTGNDLYRAKSAGYKKAFIYKTQEASAFQKEIEFYIKNLEENIKNEIFCCKLTIFYISEWFFKNGNMKRIDLTNITKVVEDAICSALQMDDSKFFRSELEKVIPIDEDFSKKMNIIFKIDFFRKRM